MSHICTMALTTTPPVTVVSSGQSSVFISDSGSFPDRISRYAWISVEWFNHHPLMLRGSGGVLGSVSVPQQQTPYLMPLLPYANYVMGSPQVGFFFQSWASHHFVYYMFGVHSGVCFLLLGAELDAIFTYCGSTIRVCTFATRWSLPMAGICATWWWSLVHTWYA